MQCAYTKAKVDKKGVTFMKVGRNLTRSLLPTEEPHIIIVF